MRAEDKIRLLRLNVKENRINVTGFDADNNVSQKITTVTRKNDCTRIYKSGSEVQKIAPEEWTHALRSFVRSCVNIHHDLNNPLAGVLGYAEFLLSEPESLTDTARKDLKQISECAERMRSIINEVATAKCELIEKVGPEALNEFLNSD